jgi:hypothetical protein
MRIFSDDEKKIIVTTVQNAFLEISGKRYHTCYHESLCMKQILCWLDPKGSYETCWGLTWFVANAPPSYEGLIRFEFEEPYRRHLKQRSRLPFYHEFRQRMAHNYVLANPGSDATIIDISTSYHSELLRNYMGIIWKYQHQFIWQSYPSLCEDLRWWYKSAEVVRDTASQEPPAGLIERITAEASARLISEGFTA